MPPLEVTIQVYTLFEEDLISQGKKEELLLDAFREDMVYNLNDNESF